MKQELTPLQRWTAPTPKFFQIIIQAAIVIAAIAAGLTATRDTLIDQGIPIPDVFAKVVEIVGWVSAAVATVSKFAVDFDELKKQEQLADIGPHDLA